MKFSIILGILILLAGIEIAVFNWVSVGDIVKADSRPSTLMLATRGKGHASREFDGCYVWGCSGQYCVEEKNFFTSCGWTEEYRCLDRARCERQPDGKCGWTPTTRLDRCVQRMLKKEGRLESEVFGN